MQAFFFESSTEVCDGQPGRSKTDHPKPAADRRQRLAIRPGRAGRRLRGLGHAAAHRRRHDFDQQAEPVDGLPGLRAVLPRHGVLLPVAGAGAALEGRGRHRHRLPGDDHRAGDRRLRHHLRGIAAVVRADRDRRQARQAVHPARRARHPAFARARFPEKGHRADRLPAGVSQRAPRQVRRIPHQSHHRNSRLRPGAGASGQQEVPGGPGGPGGRDHIRALRWAASTPGRFPSAPRP